MRSLGGVRHLSGLSHWCDLPVWVGAPPWVRAVGGDLRELYLALSQDGKLVIEDIPLVVWGL